MLALRALAASNPVISAMLVTIAAVPPKLILVVLIMSDSLAPCALEAGDVHHRVRSAERAVVSVKDRFYTCKQGLALFVVAGIPRKAAAS